MRQVEHSSATGELPHIPALEGRHFSRQEKQVVRDAVVCYVNSVRELDVLTDLIIGSDPDESLGYFWNVLAHDFDPSQTKSGTFYTLSLHMGNFYKKVTTIIPVRMSNVEHSHMNELLSRCRELNVTTTVIPIHDIHQPQSQPSPNLSNRKGATRPLQENRRSIES